MDSKQIILQWNECIDQLRSTCDDLQEHEAIELLQTSVSEGVDPSVRIMKFRSKDGHKTFETITHTTAEGLFCPIELEVQTAASGIVLRCGHAYNRKALEEYARTAALEEGNLPLRCPNHATGDKCPFLFSFEETLNILLDGEEAVGNIEKRMEIEDRLTTNFTARVASRMGIRRCVKCLVYIKVPANSKYDVHCNSCGCSFCGGCGLASHLPLPCTLAKGYEQWMDLIHKMTLSALELVCEIDITNSKPKSTEATELLQGFRRESLALIRAARGGGDEDAAGGAEGNGAAAAGGSAEAHAEVDGADGVLVDDASLPPRRDAAALRPMMTRRGRPEQGAAASSATSAAVGGGALADRSKPQEKEEEKAALKDYDVKKETKSCPACGIRVEKNSGCQHITCKHCGWEWCWSCLQAWKGHKNCDPLANLASYDFSKEFAWVKSRLSVVNGLRGGTAPSSDLSLEEFTAKRREQMQDVNDNYEGNVEKENQQEAYRHLRRQQPDPLSQLISLHDQVANGLLSRMNQFSRHMTSQRPDYEVIGMLLHRCARLMYHFPAIGSAAGRAFERLALALIGIDEKRGGPSRERIMNRPVDQRMNQLHEIMTQALGPEAIDGLTGLEMLLRDVEQRTIQVEHLAVDITLNEGYSSASRRHHHHQQQQRGLSGPLQVGMQTSTNDRYHFESLLRTAFAWRALGSYMDQNWQILVNQAARMMDAAMAAGPELAFWGPAPFAAPVAMAMMLRQRDRERVHMMMLLGHRHARRHQQHQQRIAAYHQQAAPPPPPQQQQQQEGGGIGGGGVGGFGARLRRLVPPPFFFHPAAPATNGGQAAPVAAAGGGGDGGGGEGVGDGGGGGGVVHNVAAVGAGAAAAVGAEGAGNRGDRIGAAGLLGDARQRLREVRQRLEDRRRMTMIMAQEEDEAMAIRMMMGGEPERNWLVDWAEEEEEEEAVAPRMFAPIHHPRAWHHQHQQNDAANANNNNRQNHHNNARRHLHALAFALSDAEGAIDEGTRKEFRELFQMEDVPRTSAIRIKAAVREGIKRRELAVKKIIEKLNHAGIGVSDLTQPEKESVLLKHYHEWTKASTKDQGSMMIDEEDEDHEDLEEMWEKNFRALEMMTRLGLIELPSTENLAGRLAFIDVARAADKLVTRRMLQYEGTESGSSALLAAPTANISSNSSTSSNKRRRVMGDYVSPISEEKNSYGLTPRLRESMVLLMEGITVSKEVQDEEKRETGRGKGSVSTHYSSSR